MSGGVDSSVAAFLMKEKGYQPIGVSMMLHNEDAASTRGTHSCCTPDDIEDARVVAASLGIKFQVVNYLESFRKEIIDRFVSTYMAGETPNPCIDCNKYMKFGKLFELAEKLDCEKIVTGHYATIEEKDGIYRLKRAKDRTKDQTYVLYFLDQKLLSKLDFPAGEYEKSEIRLIADKQGLPVADKHDSQDICFVPDRDYAGFIERYNNENVMSTNTEAAIINEEGDFLDKDGNVLGRHKGYFHYTLGQRKGLGISAEHPYYVVDIIKETNQVILGRDEDLFERRVDAYNFTMIVPPDFSGSDEIKLRVTAKTRYRATDTPGELTLRSDGTATMIYDEPVRAATPGQSLVVYQGEYCLGGGIIRKQQI